MTEPLLSIRNKHSAACGDAPNFGSDNPNVYIGYFENPFGEQWIFTYDRISRKAVLRGGDVGWNTQHIVNDGAVPDLVLGAEELAWIAACWRAAVPPKNT